MIKSVVVPWAIPDEGRFREVRQLLSGLGFEPGDGWKDHLSKGAPCLAPLGAIEFFHGTPPADADLIVEVEDLDRTYARARELNATVAAEPYASHWNSRIFILQVADKRIAFFTFAQAA